MYKCGEYVFRVSSLNYCNKMAGKRKRDNKETNEEPDTKVHKNVDAQTVHVSPKQAKKDKKKEKKEKKKEEKTKKEETNDFEETKTEKKQNKKKDKKKSVEPEPSPKKETKKSAPGYWEKIQIILEYFY